jgi:hypothetical protein
VPAQGRGANLLPRGPLPAPKGLPKAPVTKGVTGAVKAPGAETRVLPMPRQSQPMREARQLGTRKGLERESKAAMPKRPEGGLVSPGTITLNPFHDIATVTQAAKEGYEAAGKATGSGALAEAGKLVGNTVSGAINIPAQAIPSAYQGVKAIGEALPKGKYNPGGGKPQALENLGKEYLKQSAPAHLLKGEFHEALKAFEANPPGTALEVAGGASAADRLAGGVARGLGPAEFKGKLSLADQGSSTISRQPQKLLAPSSEHASVPLRPYDKGLVRRLAQGGPYKDRPTGVKLSSDYRKHFDRTEGALLRINRNSRADVMDQRMKAVHEGRKPVPGVDAHNLHSWGVLADPSVLNAEGTPLHRDQLSQLVEHHTKAVKGESLAEKTQRIAVRDHAQRLLDDPAYEKNPHAVYQAALRTAADKRALEPELVKHQIYTPEQMRTAKVIPAFQFHYRNQDPFVDTGTQDSPFTISDGKGGRTTLSTDQVYKELERQGVKPDQLSFTSTRPFQNENSAFNTTPGVPKRAGVKQAKGSLTGAAFKNGQYDPTYDAAVRQHLTDQKLIDEARAVSYKNSQYTLTKEHLAKLIEEKQRTLSPEDRATAQAHVADLRQGSTYFEPKSEAHVGPAGEQHTTLKSPWQRAMETKQLVEALHPDVKLAPARIAHPYAPKSYRNALLHEDITDRMDPNSLDALHNTRFPTSAVDQHNIEAGEVGLVHKAVQDRERAYERDTGSAMRNLISKPANWWRRANIAYSVRHIPGLAQEIGLRALINKIGPSSYLRGRKVYAEAMKGAEAKPFEAQRLRGMSGGTVAQMTEDLNRHINSNQLWGTRAGAVTEKFQAAVQHKITGAPLRAVRTAMQVYGKVTTGILHLQRKVLERPQEIAGLGKHLNEESKRITGKSLPVIKAMQGVHAQLAKGLLDQKALDSAGRALTEYWGDWTTASPSIKKVTVVSPFFKWYVNSLNFIYHTMPVHHPIKTGLLTALETATTEQRRALGQGYVKGLSIPQGGLAERQQGSIPIGGGFVSNQQYYSPPGAVSGGLEGALGAVFPYASDAWAILHGTNPLSGKALEENHKPITDANQKILLALLGGLESFVPPYRMGKELKEKGSPEKEDPIGRAFGIPPSVWKVIRPMRTEPEYLQTGKRKTSGGSRLPEEKLPVETLKKESLPVEKLPKE